MTALVRDKHADMVRALGVAKAKGEPCRADAPVCDAFGSQQAPVKGVAEGTMAQIVAETCSWGSLRAAAGVGLMKQTCSTQAQFWSELQSRRRQTADFMLGQANRQRSLAAQHHGGGSWKDYSDQCRQQASEQSRVHSISASQPTATKRSASQES